jgi:hypothetical protein
LFFISKKQFFPYHIYNCPTWEQLNNQDSATLHGSLVIITNQSQATAMRSLLLISHLAKAAATWVIVLQG